MARRLVLSYAGALALLEAGDRRLYDAVDKAVGSGALLGALVFPPALGVLEALPLFRQLAQGIGGRLSGTSGRRRQDLVSASHTIVVLSSVFDALAEHIGPAFASLELTDEEKLGIAAGTAHGYPQKGFIDRLITMEFPLPAAQRGFEENLEEALRPRFAALVDDAVAYFEGLRAWERARIDGDRIRGRAVASAIALYRERYVRLAADAREFLVWMMVGENAVTASRLREISAQLASIRRSHSETLGKLHDLLAVAVPERKPARTSYRAKLSRAAASVLSKPILRSNAPPPGVNLPSVTEGFVTPGFRCAIAGQGVEAFRESWWADRPVRQGLDEFLAAHLLHPEAARVPLIVLGHPGAGKSLLTEVLAARLPMQGFTVVPVQLRRVYAEDRILGQLESALQDTLHEQVSWGRLADESAELTRVVILDGYDELIQATGVAQSTYLREVQQFQEQEHDLGRNVAVIVTSRTVVMDRAWIPDGSLLVKLEEFSETQIEQWVAVWNKANRRTPLFQALEAGSVLRHGSLARQPLLLIMLAMYAAEVGAEMLDVELSTAALYERLMNTFIRRQVEDKAHRVPTPAALDRQVADHRWRLSLTAFAMFNRGRQQVGEDELERDFDALLGRDDRDTLGLSGFGAPLTRVHRTVADFFFVHVAGANEFSGGQTRRTYEFLHATFGEYLIAERALKLVRGYARQAQVYRSDPSTFEPPDDSMLRALLSYQPLSGRRATIDFVRQIVGAWPARHRAEVLAALRDLLASARTRARGRYERYDPAVFDVVTAVAAYTANLVILAHPLCKVDELVSKSLVHLWRSAFGDDTADIARAISASAKARAARYHLTGTARPHGAEDG